MKATELVCCQCKRRAVITNDRDAPYCDKHRDRVPRRHRHPIPAKDTPR